MFKIGDKVKDSVSGYEGIIIAKTKWAYNSDNSAVQKQVIGSSGIIDEAMWIDDARLDLVQEGTLAHKVMPHPPISFNMLDKVEDSISHVKGSVIGITIWLSGCVRLVLQTDMFDRDKKPVELFISQEQAILVKPVKKEKKKTSIGGPVKGQRCY